MTVNYKWSLDSGTMNILTQLTQVKNCIDELGKKRNAGVIILALHTKEAVALIKGMKDRGMNLPLFGGDAIGQQTFPALFRKLLAEQLNPGFYTDDIYTASNFIADTKGHFVERVTEEFNTKFKRTPSTS